MDVSDDIKERMLEDYNKVTSFDFSVESKKTVKVRKVVKKRKAMLYKCHLCDRTFQLKNSLNHHVKGHSGDYSC